MSVVHLKALDFIGQSPELIEAPEVRAFDPPADHIKKLFGRIMEAVEALWTYVRIVEGAEKIRDVVVDGLINLLCALSAAAAKVRPTDAKHVALSR
jgi:hypothetical protein